MGEETDRRCSSAPHVVLVAAPGQGHVNPMLCVARYLARFEIGVTLAVTHGSHAALMSQGALLIMACNIRVEVLPDNGLPPAEVLGGILRQGVHDLLQRLLINSTPPRPPPCCLIVDGILPWSHDLARLFHLPHVLLWTSCASALSIGIHIPDFRARGFLPACSIQASDRHTKMDFIPGLSSLCMTELPHWFHTEGALQFIGAAFERAKDADRVLVNSVYELESVVFDALTREDGVNAHAVGPLFLMNPNDCKSSCLHEAEEGRISSSSCLSWLDKQDKASVLYISFGTMARIEAHVYEELAHGLEASGERFLWVVRQNGQINSKGAAEDVKLPKGFVQRTAERGLVIAWAPQPEVLAHPAVAAFLTHCGWNSMLESLSNGVPMLGFPLEADQTANFKHIVHDWKVGLTLIPMHSNDEEQLVIDRSHVREAVMAIMRGSEQEAASVRKCALEWSTAIANDMQLPAARPGSSQSNLQKLVHDLKTGHFKPSL